MYHPLPAPCSSDTVMRVMHRICHGKQHLPWCSWKAACCCDCNRQNILYYPTAAQSMSGRRAVWQPDASALQCNKCTRKFSLALRKHHCRCTCTCTHIQHVHTHTLRYAHKKKAQDTPRAHTQHTHTHTHIHTHSHTHTHAHGRACGKIYCWEW